jgi:steroid 5-alpha reductase family enzyme
MVCVWGLRLGAFLLNRVLVRGKDDRFDEIRGRFWSFLGFWVFQIVWVWLVSFPVTLVNASKAVVALNGLDWFGFALWLMGFLVESVADQVKYGFTRNPANRGKWIDTGVWSWR